MPASSSSIVSVAAVTALIAGCGSTSPGGGGGGGGGGGQVATSIAKSGGDAQTGVVNNALANPLSVRAADQSGGPVAGVTVSWQVTGGTATVNPSASSTGSNGEAQTTVTLGGAAGTIAIEAVSTGLSGSPLSFMATAMPLPSMVTVQVVNNSFQPRDIILGAGGTVTWNWGATAINHNVMPDAAQPVRSGDPTNGPNTYQFTFNTPGTYMYYCVVHGAPGGVGMSGTITVQ